MAIRGSARDAAGVASPLSSDLDDPAARPYFVWDEVLTYADLRRKLVSPDPDERALWMGRVMREARYHDVWRLLRLRDVLDWMPRIDRHLGRSRPFWHWLIQGWRDDGLIPRTWLAVAGRAAGVLRSRTAVLVDLVVERTPDVDAPQSVAGGVRIHSLREIAANRVCALLGRGEVRDLIDLCVILREGLDLRAILADAERKDGGVAPATPWLQDSMRIGADAKLPAVTPAELEAFRIDLVRRLRRLDLPAD